MDSTYKIRRNLLIGFFVAICFSIYYVYRILSPFLICTLLVYLFAPIVQYLSEKGIKGVKLSRGLSVALIYVTFLGVLILLGTFLFPMLFVEVKKIASDIPKQINDFKDNSLPLLVSNIQDQFDSFGVDVNLQSELDKNLSHILSSSEGKIENFPKYIQNIIGGFFSTLTTLVVIIIFTAFVLIDLPKLKATLLRIIPWKYQKGVTELAIEINRDLGGAIRGQLIICILNGLLTTIGLFVLKIKYAVTLGIIAAIFSLIPIFGTIFSLVPTVAIALTQSWVAALEVVAVVLLIHLIEANFFNPKIMGSSVELHPAIIIFSIYVGEHLFGMAGLLLAVPVVAIIRSIIIFLYRKYFMENAEVSEISIN